jgi:hypothetical protein
MIITKVNCFLNNISEIINSGLNEKIELKKNRFFGWSSLSLKNEFSNYHIHDKNHTHLFLIWAFWTTPVSKFVRLFCSQQTFVEIEDIERLGHIRSYLPIELPHECLLSNNWWRETRYWTNKRLPSNSCCSMCNFHWL